MLIINDFFKRKKEAVSNQMEALLNVTGGKIIAATRFMNQKAFQKEDIKDNIFIYPPFLYQIIMTIHVLFSKDDIHIFEEEPNRYKVWLFNLSKKNIYVSMYRKPFKKYVDHINKYKKLKGIFVELDDHKQLLLKYGIKENLIHITPTPAKIKRKKNNKTFDSKKINLLFASWNNMEKGDHLKERGLIYLLDLLVLNPNLSLTILLRDNKTKKFIEIATQKKVINRIRLIDVEEKNLEKEFDNTDFVVFTIQKTLTKDVPNSFIDGISRGKPLILTDVFGFSKIVKEENIGIVIKPNTKAKKLNITKKDYDIMSENSYKVSKIYTNKNYTDSIIKNYRRTK